MCHRTLQLCKPFVALMQKYPHTSFCCRAKMFGMNTETAIKLAGGRRKLAALLGVAYISTYRWKPDLPQHRADRLRILKPRWFQPARIEAIERAGA